MISTRSAGLLIDTVVCLTLAKWETVSGRFGGYLIHQSTPIVASCSRTCTRATARNNDHRHSFTHSTYVDGARTARHKAERLDRACASASLTSANTNAVMLAEVGGQRCWAAQPIRTASQTWWRLSQCPWQSHHYHQHLDG